MSAAPDPTPTPTPQPTPEPTPTVTDWKESAGLSADLKSHPHLSRFKDANALASSYVELHRKMSEGGERVPLPKEDASDEEWASFYAATGRPETVEGYGLGEFTPPEELPWDGDFMGKMVERLHAHGLSTRQAKAIVEDYARLDLERWQGIRIKHEEEMTATEKALKAKYGTAFPAKFDDARRAMIRFAGPSTDEEPNIFDRLYVDGVQLGSHPEVLEFMMAVGEQMGEDTGPPPGGRTRVTMTPDEAGKKLAAIYSDAAKMKILSDESHPEYKILYAEVTALQKMQFPEESK